MSLLQRYQLKFHFNGKFKKEISGKIRKIIPKTRYNLLYIFNYYRINHYYKVIVLHIIQYSKEQDN
jgi:hypothetical protein